MQRDLDNMNINEKNAAISCVLFLQFMMGYMAEGLFVTVDDFTVSGLFKTL